MLPHEYGTTGKLAGPASPILFARARKGGRLGKLDKKQKNYFKDPKRFADIWNGILFGGREVFDWRELSECDSVLTSSKGKGIERIPDMVMKRTAEGNLLAVLIVENLLPRDYSIPFKVNLQEAIAYEKQVNEIKRRNRELEKAMKDPESPGEFLNQFRREDKVRPVITLVLYWNEEPWDGVNSLDELIDFRGVEGLRKFVPRHPIRVVDMARLSGTERFKTDLRSLIELFQRRNNKEAFKDYYSRCEEKYVLQEDGMDVLGELVHSEELMDYVKKTKGGTNMCRAIKEMVEEGRKQGFEEGLQKGFEKANAKVERANARADREKARAEREKAKNIREKGKSERAEMRADKAEKEVERLKKLLEDAGVAI